ETAMALDVAELEVRGDGGQRVALPLAGGEATVRGRGVLRWMRPSGPPGYRLVAIAPPRDLPREQLLGDRVRHHGELQRERADDGVDRRVALARAASWPPSAVCAC